jgi:hypothetical protein
MKHTALIALSSPEGTHNYFSKLINFKIDGVSLFRVCDCQLVCEECKKLDRELQVKCTHVKQTPPWLSESRTNKWKMISMTDPATALREYAGLIVDEFQPCFKKELIDRMFTNLPVSIGYTPKYVFIAVDPNGGGISQLAICSGYYDDLLNFVIVGLEVETVKTDVAQIQTILRQHISRLNSIPQLTQSVKVFIPENNLGHEAAHMWNMIKKDASSKLKAYYENGKDRIGIHKGKDTADQYRYTFDVKLHNDAILFSEHFFTVSRKHTISNIKGLAKEQLERCQFSFEEPKDEFGKAKYTITGKIGGDQDDLSVAIQQAVYHGYKALNKPEFIK